MLVVMAHSSIICSTGIFTKMLKAWCTKGAEIINFTLTRNESEQKNRFKAITYLVSSS